MKLEHYGIRDSALLWFESYLSKRNQFVSIMQSTINLIYINDLPDISNKLDIFLFADDTNIYYENDSFIKLEKIVNKELKNLYSWFSVD